MSFSLFEEKCRKAGLSQAAIDAFKYNYDQLLAGETGLVRGCGSEVVGSTVISMYVWLICRVSGDSGAREHNRSCRFATLFGCLEGNIDYRS